MHSTERAGREARPRIRERLELLGIEVTDIVLPAEFKDVNEMLQKGRTDFSFKAIKQSGQGVCMFPDKVVSVGEPKVEKKQEDTIVK